MTLIGASRDTLRVLRAEPGAQPEELKPARDDVEILSGTLDEVWHDGWRRYAPFVYDNGKTVVHSKNSLRMTAFTSTKSNVSGRL